MGPWLRVVRLLLFAALLVAAGMPAFGAAKGPAGGAVILHLDGDVDPNSARHLARGLRKAAEDGVLVVVLQINTPGGLIDSMRDMVTDILASPVPVVTYVYPQGARAGSAGTFIAAAGHVAAMAPGTNIGAASPISGTGEDLPPTLGNKVMNDAAALIRSIAETRGRNADSLEQTVRNAASYSARQAVDLHMVDLLADNLDDLMAKVDGRTVHAGPRDVTLQTRDIRCEEPRQGCNDTGGSFYERFIDVLSNPNVVLLLLILASAGIIIEVMSPGLVLPGVLGLILLALVFVGLGNLPVNWLGVLLVLAAIALFVVELHVPGFGVFGIGAIICFVVGALLIFAPFAAAPPSISAPRVHVSLWLIGGIGGGLGVALALVFTLAWRGKSATPAPRTLNRLIGMSGKVTADLSPVGTVYVADEPWTAEEEGGQSIAAGEAVEVVDVQGLVLKVRRSNPQ